LSREIGPSVRKFYVNWSYKRYNTAIDRKHAFVEHNILVVVQWPSPLVVPSCIEGHAVLAGLQWS